MKRLLFLILFLPLTCFAAYYNNMSIGESITISRPDKVGTVDALAYNVVAQPGHENDMYPPMKPFTCNLFTTIPNGTGNVRINIGNDNVLVYINGRTYFNKDMDIYTGKTSFYVTGVLANTQVTGATPLHQFDISLDGVLVNGIPDEQKPVSIFVQCHY